MDFHGKLWGYFLALTLSLGVALTPWTAGPLSVGEVQEIPTEKVSAHDHHDLILIVSQSNYSYSNCFRTGGDSTNIHFFNEGNFQFVFLKNIFATAYSILKATDLNFEFIDLLYPFHYFW